MNNGNDIVCDICQASLGDMDDPQNKALAALLCIVDIPYPCGFALCEQCKRTITCAKLEALARERWIEALEDVKIVAKKPEEQPLADTLKGYVSWQARRKFAGVA